MPRRLWRLAPLAIVVLGSVVFFALGMQEAFSFAAWAERADVFVRFARAHLMLALFAYLLIFVVAIALCFPAGALLFVAGGFVFGVGFGAPIGIVGATLGSTLFFLIARTALGAFLHQRARGLVARLEDGLRADAFNYMLALRLAPIVPLAVTNLAAGLLDVKLKDFVTATLLGLLPVGFVLAWTGESLREAIAAGANVDPAHAAQAAIFSPQILSALLGLMLVSLAPVILRRWKRFRV